MCLFRRGVYLPWPDLATAWDGWGLGGVVLQIQHPRPSTYGIVHHTFTP